VSDISRVAPQPNADWTCGQVRDELEAWALGALEPEEADPVERHIAICEACRHEASALGGIARLLPFSLTPVSPSSAARDALMSRIADEQMAVAEAQSQLSLRPAGPARPEESVETARRYHWSQLLVTPLAIALLVMTLWSLELREQAGDRDGGDAPRAATVSMLPEGFQTYTMQSKCEKCKATGKLLADPEQANALMVAWDLDPSQIHQVWCQSEGGQPVLVASLDVSDSGEVVQPLVFDQPISGYSRIFVVNHDGEISEIRLAAGGPLSPSPAPLQRR
jgi:anti-sigma factor RsiW